MPQITHSTGKVYVFLFPKIFVIAKGRKNAYFNIIIINFVRNDIDLLRHINNTFHPPMTTPKSDHSEHYKQFREAVALAIQDLELCRQCRFWA